MRPNAASLFVLVNEASLISNYKLKHQLESARPRPEALYLIFSRANPQSNKHLALSRETRSAMGAVPIVTRLISEQPNNATYVATTTVSPSGE